MKTWHDMGVNWESLRTFWARKEAPKCNTSDLKESPLRKSLRTASDDATHPKVFTG